MNAPAPFCTLPVLERPLGRGFAPWLGAALLRLSGWKVVLAQPVPTRCVAIFYPHTSNWDTAIGLCVKFMTGSHWKSGFYHLARAAGVPPAVD